MKTLTFEQISDSRFGGSKSKLKQLTEDTISALSQLTGVKVEVEDTRELNFTETTSKSWRQRFYVKKSGRKASWNDIYKAVNSVKAVPYRFI